MGEKERAKKAEELEKKKEKALKAAEEKKDGEEKKEEERKEEEKKEEEIKEDEPEEDEEEEEAEVEAMDEEPPKVELTAEEKKTLKFVYSQTPDVSSYVLSTSFGKFSAPKKEEGFDDIRYDWEKERAKKAEELEKKKEKALKAAEE